MYDGPNADIERRLDDIAEELSDIKKTLEFVKETMVKADGTITKVAAEVMPTLNSLMESPMLKMLTGGKKK